MNKKQIIATLKVRARNLAKERDKLRSMQDDIEELFDCADEATRLLEDCIDRLSELL